MFIHNNKSLISLLFFLSLSPLLAKAAVPASAQFKFVNDGEFGDYVVEYLGNYRVLSLGTSPFQVAFYNTTPNAYTLALRMATTRSESLFRWVWEANRGKPVKENATFSLGSDGNLVLAEADGTIVWQTNTANKGVVGFELLPNGNMVLYDKKGKFIWQSFDYPTDTLLVGQSLKAGSKLVSRLSAKSNSNGPYSLVVESKGISLYYSTKNSPKPYLYFSDSFWSTSLGSIDNVTFTSEPETEEAYSYEVQFDFNLVNSSNGHTLNLARPKYNATLSILRLGIDGNLRVFTYYDKVDYRAWEETFTLFDSGSAWATGCQLPEKCGNFGLCEDDQCVACPLPSGLSGWSKSCEPVKVNSCKASDFHYYKVEGVDYFLSKFTKGSSIKESNCAKKCSSDCKCMGYFYNGDTSKCWIAYDLKTLAKSENSTHIGYIKTPNK
ncbi:hypothetical protein ACFE04_024402 [Oxalis oulophora]